MPRKHLPRRPLTFAVEYQDATGPRCLWRVVQGHSIGEAMERTLDERLRWSRGRIWSIRTLPATRREEKR